MNHPARLEGHPRVIVLLNAGAGSVERDGCAALTDQVTAAFARRGAVARCETVPGGELRAAAQRALDEIRRGSAEIVAVGGGDGSLRAVAGVLADTTIPLGILPLGTRNHFAKDLAIPLDLDGAVGAICAGTARPV